MIFFFCLRLIFVWFYVLQTTVSHKLCCSFCVYVVTELIHSANSVLGRCQVEPNTSCQCCCIHSSGWPSPSSKWMGMETYLSDGSRQGWSLSYAWSRWRYSRDQQMLEEVSSDCHCGWAASGWSGAFMPYSANSEMGSVMREMVRSSNCNILHVIEVTLIYTSWRSCFHHLQMNITS